MTGYRAEEFIGSNLHELLHHSWPDGTRYPEEECAFRKALDGAHPLHVVGETLWRKDGTSFLAECRVLPLPRSANQTTGMVTFQDRSELQQAQDILREGEEKFRRILASVPDMVWTSDRLGRTIYISPKAEAVFGYTKQEICASTELWMGRIHPEDFGRVRQAHGALFEQQISFDEEFRIRRKDGEWTWVHVRALGAHMEDGARYADGILTDITRRKQAEAELRSKTAFLEAQADSTIDGILVVDDGGRRILQNQRYAELFKIPLDMLSNKDDRQMLGYVAELIKNPESFRARVDHLNSHPRETSRDEVELKDGTILDRYSSPVIDAKNTYYGRIWTFRDITERRRNEDTLRQLSMAVEQSPVSVVITNPQGNITYVNRKFTESTGYQPEKTATDLNRAIESTITVARSEWKYVADIGTDFDETMPPVVCYPGDINQVILNLLVNAAHAIHDKVKDEREGTDYGGHAEARGEFVEISVTDTGSGIPEAIRTRILIRSSPPRRSAKEPGKGLSLAHTVDREKTLRKNLVRD